MCAPCKQNPLHNRPKFQIFATSVFLENVEVVFAKPVSNLIHRFLYKEWTFCKVDLHIDTMIKKGLTFGLCNLTSGKI